jgi:Tol biopolymer transport system component/DNA-binding winged helix-turn-helix (wHTH) protein
MSPQPNHLYEFGPFRLNVAERLLLRDGEVVPLTPKAFDLLLVLVSHHGRLLGKDELMKAVWSDTFVEEGNLSWNVSHLRKALGDGENGQRYIETVPKRGYRFVASVKEVTDANAEPIVEAQPDLRGDSQAMERAATSDDEARAQRKATPDSDLGREVTRNMRVALVLNPLRFRPKRRLIWLAAYLALALVSGAAGWLIIARFTAEPPASPLKTIPLTSFQGAEWFPSFSPDGTQVAFTWDGEKQDNSDIYTRPVGHEAMFRLTDDPAKDWSPAWSPDGRWIAFLRFRPDGKAGVFLTTPLSRAERQLTERAAPWPRGMMIGSHLAWSPDSKWIATADKNSPELPFGLILISVETGEKRILTAPSKGENDTAPAFSPDGRSLAFIRILSFHVSELYLLRLTDDLKAKEEPIRLTYEYQRTSSPVWSQDGREIIFASGDVWISRLYRIAADKPGKPREIESVGEAGQLLAISHPARRLAYVREVFDPNIWRLRIGADGKADGAPTSFISSTRVDFQPQFSPDGKRVAFSSNRSGHTEIWVCESDSSNAVQLTSFGGPTTESPRWSPDGERIAFQSYSNGHTAIYLVNARGGTPERLTHGTSNDGVPSWSRDGRWIYFHSNRSGASQVWKMRTDGSGAVQVTRNGGGTALESADGKFLYYSKATPRGPSLWRVPVEDGEEVEVLEGISDATTFALTDQGIYFIPRREPTAGASIQFLSFADGKIKTIIAIAKPVFVGFTVSRDGQSLLYTQIDQEGSDIMLLENFR